MKFNMVDNTNDLIDEYKEYNIILSKYPEK